MQPAPLTGRKRARGSRRIETGAPQCFVGEEVAEAGHSPLVHQPGLEWRLARIERVGEFPVGDRRRVGAETILVRIEQHAAEPAWVVDAQVAAVLEVDDESIPPGVQSMTRVYCNSV